MNENALPNTANTEFIKIPNFKLIFGTPQRIS